MSHSDGDSSAPPPSVFSRGDNPENNNTEVNESSVSLAVTDNGMRNRSQSKIIQEHVNEISNTAAFPRPRQLHLRCMQHIFPHSEQRKQNVFLRDKAVAAAACERCRAVVAGAGSAAGDGAGAGAGAGARAGAGGNAG